MSIFFSGCEQSGRPATEIDSIIFILLFRFYRALLADDHSQSVICRVAEIDPSGR